MMNIKKIKRGTEMIRGRFLTIILGAFLIFASGNLMAQTQKVPIESYISYEPLEFNIVPKGGGSAGAIGTQIVCKTPHAGIELVKAVGGLIIADRTLVAFKSLYRQQNEIYEGIATSYLGGMFDMTSQLITQQMLYGYGSGMGGMGGYYGSSYNINPYIR